MVTSVGDNFLDKNEKSKTTTISKISKSENWLLIIIFKNNPEEYVYQDTIAVPNNPKNIQKNVLDNSLLVFVSKEFTSFIKMSIILKLRNAIQNIKNVVY